MDRKISIEISWASLWKFFFFGLLVILLFWGRQIILGLFLAIIISSGLDPLISFLERRRLPRALSVILIFILVVLGLIILLYTVIPILLLNINSVLFEVGKYVGDLQLGGFLDLRGQSLNSVINEFFGGGDSSPLGLFSTILGGLGLALAVFFSSFYLSLSRGGVEKFIRAVIPDAYEESALNIYKNSWRRIGVWFQTQILLSLVVGFLVWLALWILGVKYPVLLAVLAGIFEFVPFVGPILAGALSVLSALTTSVALALWTLLAFLAIQQFEGHLLVPLVTRKTVGLHPVIVIIALLIGIEAGGILGALIAVPAAAVFEEIIEEWSAKKKLKTA